VAFGAGAAFFDATAAGVVTASFFFSTGASFLGAGAGFSFFGAGFAPSYLLLESLRSVLSIQESVFCVSLSLE